MTQLPTPQLFADERIIWEGRPYQGFLVRPIEIFLIPFSLAWGGFALYWNISVWTTGAPIFFSLFGLPFLAMGLYFVIGRFYFDAAIRKRIAYFVTNKRILIVKGGQELMTKSLDLDRLPSLEFDERQDGTGTIRFGAPTGLFGANNFGIWQPTSDPSPQFIRIPNVRSAYEIIRRQAGR